MKTLEMTKATAPLAKYARNVNKESVILTRSGKPVAALVPIKNADWETVRLSTHPGFLALIERSRARQKREGGLSSSEMRKRLGLKPTASAK
jgi:prevent-host-death family protein